MTPARRGLAVLIALVAASAAPAGDAAPAVAAFGEVFAVTGWASALAAHARRATQPMTPAMLRDLAGRCGFPCELRQLTIEQLTELGRPALVFWNQPGDPTLVLHLDDEWLQGLEGHDPLVVPRREAAAWFPVTALVPLPRAGPAPRVRLEHAHAELGELLHGEVVKHTFTVTNAGDAPLQLGAVEYNCRSCTEARLGATELAPGASAPIDVTFRAMEIGRYGSNVRIRTNDPLCPLIALTWTVQTPAGYEISPPWLTVNAAKGEPVDRSITLTMPAGVQVRETRCDIAGAEVAAERLNGGDVVTVWRVRVQLPPRPTPGTTKGTVTVVTTDPKRETLTVAVTAEVPASLLPRPAAVFVDGLAPGESRAAEIHLTLRGGGEFAVREATCAAPWVTIGPVERTEGGWRIALTVTPARDGFQEAALEITTDVPGEERLTLPIGARAAAR